MDPRANQLIATLPELIFQQWLPHLEAVEMPLDRVLYEPGCEVSHVYFPTTSIVSLLYVLDSGHSTEIAIAGREGIVGISCLMGGGSTNHQAVVLSAGHGFRLRADFIVDAFEQGGPVMHLLLRYNQALITQMAQRAVCNRHHSVDQQLCRWLLGCLDRLETNELVMTHERISNMLGVRREGVTETAIALQRDGLINYARGHICVVDRPALERRSCECYAVVKKEYGRLLPASTAT